MAERVSQADWRITPGNSSPLTDGASAMLIVSEETAVKLGLTPSTWFVYAVAGDGRVMMLTALIPATQKALARASLGIDDIEAYEVNEAFVRTGPARVGARTTGGPGAAQPAWRRHRARSCAWLPLHQVSRHPRHASRGLGRPVRLADDVRGCRTANATISECL